MLDTCETCGNQPKFLDDHRIIPKIAGILNTEGTIQACKSCHRKADRKMIELLINPFHTNCIPFWRNEESVGYNKNTGSISIAHAWNRKKRKKYYEKRNGF